MKHRKALWKSCVLILCLWAGWQTLVGADGIRPRPSAARPYVQGTGYFPQGGQVGHQLRKADAGAAPAGKAAVSYAQLPLSFEANQGQTDKAVKFLSRGRGYGLFLTDDAAVLELEKPSVVRSPLSVVGTRSSRAMNASQRTTDNGRRTTNSVLRLKLVNANPNAAVTGARELPGKVNYFLGNDPKKWRSNVPTYAQVRYRNVYPGIDLFYYGNQGGQLEYDFVVAPGADPSPISLAVDASAQVGSRQKAVGSGQPKVASNGDLVVRTDGNDEVRFQKPVVYQEQESEVRSQESGAKNPQQGAANNRKSPITNRKSVEGRFIVDAQNRVHFALGPYDRAKPLVIDPSLVYSTYLGGSSDQAKGIAVDSSGNAYVTGTTSSTSFPLVDPFQPTNKATNGTAFVSKFNANGSALVYSTYLGGSTSEKGNAIAVDSSGTAYLTGSTCSSDFPTVYPIQASLKGVCDGFVAKLDAAGSSLVYSTFLGGSGTVESGTNLSDEGTSIAVDSSGDAYVAGGTWSTDFPTVNPVQGYGGGEDAFICKFSADGKALVYSTYIGGSSYDGGSAIAVDSAGNAYVIGSTLSTDFPTVNPLQATDKATLYGTTFVAKLNSAGSALVYSTYLGGSVEDSGEGIAVDSFGNAYLTGATWSSDFPTVNPLQATNQSKYGAANAFVAKLNAAGSALVYSTYLGGSGHLYNMGPGEWGDNALGIAIDPTGVACVAGTTGSNDFPTVNAVQASNNDTNATPNFTAFVTCLNAAGSALAYSTYLGGSWQAQANGIAIDSSRNVYVAGTNGDDFPTVNPLQASPGGAFVAMISPPPAVTLFPTSLNFGTVLGNTTSPEQSVTLTPISNAPVSLTAITASGDFALVSTATSCPYGGGQVAAGATCTIDVTFTPTSTSTKTGALTITYTGQGSPQSVSLTGTGVATAPVADVSTNSLTFGSQLLGTTSAAQPVTLSNTGNVALIVTGISTIGDFGQTNNCGGRVAAGGSCIISVTFTPQSNTLPTGPTTLTGALTITDNSSDTTGSTQTVSLSGTWQDFALTTPSGSASSATISPGQTATYTLSVVGEGGFDQTVALSCGGVPTQSTCALSPNPAVPGSNFTLIVTTTAPSAIAPRTLPPPPFPRPQILLMLAVLLACIAWTIRASRQVGARRRAVLLPLAAGLLLALALAGCGGGSSGIQGNYGTTAGTYNLTVTGTAVSGSATLSHSATVTLKVS